MRTRFSIIFCLTFIMAAADFGPCRYDENRCSCKYGKAREGICWDKVSGSSTSCTRRFCNAGWTCSCGDRTNVCSVSKKRVYALKNPEDKGKEKADCKQKDAFSVSGRELKLGTLKFFFSKAGMAADDCTSVAWWIDGVLHGYHNAIRETNEAKLEDVISARQDHSMLELKADSLIAFRVKNGSYYCFEHYAEMVVNGVAMTTRSPGVTIHYARKYVSEWFTPQYRLTADKVGTDEKDSLEKFLPIRKTTLSTAEEITPAKDYWAPSEVKAGDTMRSNWYYRIQLTPPTIFV